MLNHTVSMWIMLVMCDEWKTQACIYIIIASGLFTLEFSGCELKHDLLIFDETTKLLLLLHHGNFFFFQ